MSPVSGRRRYTGERIGPLTPMESEVARMVARAMTDKEIAFSLGTTVGTVRVLLSRTYRKLGFPNEGNHRVRLASWVNSLAEKR